MATTNYNRGKYNVSAGTLAVTGTTRMGLTVDVTPALTVDASNSAVFMRLGTEAHNGKKYFAPPSASEMGLNTASATVVRLYAPTVIADTSLNVAGTSLRDFFATICETDLGLDASGRGTRRLFTIEDVTNGGNVANMALRTGGRVSLNMFSVNAAALLAVDTNGRVIKRFSINSPSISTALNAKGSAAMIGYSALALPGLVIPPNGDLIIDTGEMTVTLNGDDVTRYFSSESEFFKLKPGDNVIIYEDGQQNRNISYKILWKDLWV